MINVCILGVSGSIGTQAIDILKKHKDKFKLVSFSVGSNNDYANEILSEFQDVIAVATNNTFTKINHNNVLTGDDGLTKVATIKEVDVVLVAVSGFAGVIPTINAIKENKDIALANKETLVCAGHIVKKLVKEHKIKLIPVDSEHSAIYQCLNGESKRDIKKLVLTASGGSFRDKTRKELENVSVKDALNHPNWSMGSHITIDSATMFNKGLEVIEAHHLFDVNYDDIEVLIHKQSIVHSAVTFQDENTIAQLSLPDMRLPIVYALSNEKRIITKGINNLDLAKIGQLTFEEVDFNRFKALEYAIDAGKMGGTMPTVLNAAKEIAVQLFLDEKIQFLEIEEIVKKELDSHKIIKDPTLEEIITTDLETREIIIDKYDK